MSVKDNITFCTDTVIKTGEPHLMRVEVEKTNIALQIGRQSGLFRVPEIIDYDAIKGKVVFERITDIHGVRHAVSHGEKYGEILERIGIALAEIHKKLELPEDMVDNLPEEFCFTGNEVFLHGDFSVDNICVSDKNHAIIILDWQMTKMHGGKATYGTRYFDIVWFINNLFTKPFHKYLSGPSVRRAAEKFLSGYISNSDVSWNTQEFASYMMKFYITKMAQRRKRLTWKRRLLLWPGHVSWHMFTKSINSNNKQFGQD